MLLARTLGNNRLYTNNNYKSKDNNVNNTVADAGGHSLNL
jgi:hypothetical protein